MQVKPGQGVGVVSQDLVDDQIGGDGVEAGDRLAIGVGAGSGEPADLRLLE
jgi:hypothetical protein